MQRRVVEMRGFKAKLLDTLETLAKTVRYYATYGIFRPRRRQPRRQ
jgi:DNA-binding transcriptional MerR regulator